MLFTGDLLSAGTIGTTRDGYARGLLLAVVRKKLLPLGDEILVFPGHGPPSKLGIEKLYNPFLGEKPRESVGRRRAAGGRPEVLPSQRAAPCAPLVSLRTTYAVTRFLLWPLYHARECRRFVLGPSISLCRNSFSRSCVMQTNAHSRRTFLSPRCEKRRKPRACSIWPNTGSTMTLRRAYTALPAFLLNFSRMRVFGLSCSAESPDGAAASVLSRPTAM